MEKDDAQLASESVLGSERSFDELVRRYSTQLYRFTYRLTGNAQTAEDCVQETFIKVWKKLSSYDREQNFRSWIFTIARNTAFDSLRKKKSIPFSNLSFDDSTPFEETLSADEASVEETVAKAIEAEGLQGMLELLPLEHRTVLTLHYQEDMTFDEIGKIMGRPLNTVKSWHRRALQKLHQMTR